MTTYTVSPCSSAEEIPTTAWDRLAPAGHPFLNADFLRISERHGAAGRPCGWLAQHLLARDAQGRIVGLLPLYLRANSHGDFIHDWAWASAYRESGRAYYPKLTSALPHTPASGPRLLVDTAADEAAVRRALIDAAKALAEAYDVSSWHVAFPAAEEREVLRAAGLLLSHHVQFHWHAGNMQNFDDYLAAFTAEKRRKVRAERRRVRESGLRIEVCHGDEVAAAEWPALHALYASTFEKYGNYPVFSAACFAELAAVLGRKMVAFIARDGKQAVAVALCFRGADTLYGRYWGCLGSYHSLHFELCFYQGIEYCLRTGLRRFEPGAGGEHKVARGFVPAVVYSCHWLRDPLMHALIARHLQQQEQLVAAYRDDAAEHLPFRNTQAPTREPADHG